MADDIVTEPAAGGSPIPAPTSSGEATAHDPASAAAGSGIAGDVNSLDPNAQGLVDQFKGGMSPDAQQAFAEMTARAEKAEGERDALQARIDKAKASAKVAARDEPAKPRKLAALAEGKALDREALKAAIADADDVEIAFSDGRKEVAGVPPVGVTGEAWKDHALGLMLTEAVEIHGPATGQTAFVIEGYALMLDGKQAAFTPRAPLNVSAGGTVKLENDIYF